MDADKKICKSYISNPIVIDDKKEETNKKQELIQKEIREQTGSVCICNVSDIWCSYCYGEFDIFD